MPRKMKRNWEVDQDGCAVVVTPATQQKKQKMPSGRLDREIERTAKRKERVAAMLAEVQAELDELTAYETELTALRAQVTAEPE